jgi:hypothetical protein
VFGFRSKPRLPANPADRLTALGRFEMDVHSSGIDPTHIWEECISPFRQVADADPEGFLAALRTVVAQEAGGFATYGAYRLAGELLGFEYRSENALAIMDDAIAFKRARGLPSARLTGYEWQRWCEKHGAETW